MNHTKSLVFLITAASLLAACGSTAVNPTGPAAPSAASSTPGAPASAPGAAQRPVPAPTVASVMLPAHLDPRSAISAERSVFFDFDEFVVKNEYSAMIDRHGKYLASSSTLAIKIEGHTDERGGSEYNLALGQRRAEAVLRALRIYGVKPAQMEAVSFGEERPKAAGHDEAAWAQNRRADLQYPKP